MNGELLDLVQISSNAKAIIRGGSSEFSQAQYIESVKFFIKGQPTFIEKLVRGKDQKFREVASSVNDWYEYLVSCDTKDVFLSLGKVEEQDINLSAFANGVPKWCMLTMKDNGSLLAWYRRWYRDEYINKWHVEFYGLPSNLLDSGIIESAEGLKEALYSRLTDIIELSQNIREESWVSFFERARKKLVDDEPVVSNHISGSYPELNHRLIETVSLAWCFGGMGSWNDSPPYSAHTAGLDEEFKRVTEGLYNIFLDVIEATVNVY
ncbi:hypothetical protein EDC18_101415 [Natranaerovirga pectinivora]|uniref:Uncharacterized protein n=1 Tax=Natranaerovirga pectinivora TaxID=682400 RepID=A0A4R3MSB5_9FIRM|nr:hypothetical protein [Natranaerovirga pectinivora]TCT17118.1 hypothetical protein EDC18_101415 [Natranaerovirga pectinivora]